MTLADVAREAGVNASTVSRVLNDRATVRPATRARIEAASARLRYRPSRDARNLAAARTWTVGVLLPDFANLMHPEFLRGAQGVAQQLGYSLIICDGQLNPDVQAAELTRFLELRVEGVLLSRSFTLRRLLGPIIEAGIPIEPVEVLRPARRSRLNRLRRGSVEAFRSLYAAGHRDVAMFVHERADAPARSAEMRSRIDSLLTAHDQRAARDGRVHVVPIADPTQCASQLRALLEAEHPPTALIAGNDWMTAPLLGAVQELGLAIPGDVSVIAYGDSSWAMAYRPPISVIRYDYRREGELLARRLFARLGEPIDEGAARGALVPDEFVPRGSCAPPRRSRSTKSPRTAHPVAR